jgi:hypothetical protein
MYKYVVLNCDTYYIKMAIRKWNVLHLVINLVTHFPLSCYFILLNCIQHIKFICYWDKFLSLAIFVEVRNILVPSVNVGGPFHLLGWWGGMHYAPPQHDLPHIHDSRPPSQNSRLANPTSFQFDPHQKVSWTHDHLASEWNCACGFQFRIA